VNPQEYIHQAVSDAGLEGATEKKDREAKSSENNIRGVGGGMGFGRAGLGRWERSRKAQGIQPIHSTVPR
jgi:hypothetical protein